MRTAAGMIKRWAWAETSAIGLARAVEPPVEARRPPLELEVRAMRPDEERAFGDVSLAVDDADAVVRTNAAHLFSTGLRTPYVALVDGVPAYMQYLVLPDENDRLADVFDRRVPRLAADEALLEFAYTLPPYRAFGVMPHVMATLVDAARAAGARRVVTWVPDEHVAFHRYYRRLGFDAFAVRRESIRLFRRRVAFAAIASG